MVAYNFKSQFVEPIRLGIKTQTIRPIGKRRHAKPGESLQLYTGMRTDKCEKIIDDPICLSVQPITLDFRPRCIPSIKVEDHYLCAREAEVLAVSDGFGDLYEMIECFISLYGSLRDDMVLIKWGGK